MSDDRKPSPAYVSYSTLKSTIRGIAHEGRPPSRIDTSVLGKMSGSAKAQFLNALRYLSLITEDNKPTESLSRLCASGENEWKSIMSEILRAKYHDQLSALKDGTPKTFKESFGEIAPSLVIPASRFLWSAAKDAGLPISGHIKEISNAPRTSKKSTSKPAVGDEIEGESDGDVSRAETQRPTTTIQERLIEKFPDFDPGWDESRQTSWFAAYQKLMEITSKGGES